MPEEISIDSAGRTIIRNTEDKPVEYGEGYHLLTDPDNDSEAMRKELGNEMAALVLEVANQKPDVLVWLDKSARPAEWFFNSMWHELYATQPHPENKFVNIGQEKAPGEAQERELLFDREMFKARVRSNEKQVLKLRQHFRVTQKDKRNVDPEKTYLDGKNILILDEYSSTGGSLTTAQALFEAAFGSRYYDNIHSRNIFTFEPPWMSILQHADPDALGVVDRKPGDFAVKGISPVPQEVRQLKKELAMLAKETISRLMKTDPRLNSQ